MCVVQRCFDTLLIRFWFVHGKKPSVFDSFFRLEFSFFCRSISANYFDGLCVHVKLFTIISCVLSLHFSYPAQWTLFYSSGISYFHWYSTVCCCCCCFVLIYLFSIYLSLCRSVFSSNFCQREPNSIQRTLQNTKQIHDDKIKYCILLFDTQTVLRFSVYLILFVSSTDIEFLVASKYSRISVCLRVYHFPLHHFINRCDLELCKKFSQLSWITLRELLDALELFSLVLSLYVCVFSFTVRSFVCCCRGNFILTLVNKYFGTAGNDTN